jgi:site-specific recombinase XerD
MINEFLQYLQYEKNYSSHTVLSYHTDLLQFCKFIATDADKFSPTHIEPARAFGVFQERNMLRRVVVYAVSVFAIHLYLFMATKVRFF